MDIQSIKKYIAEFVGTCVLVLFGCGSAVAANALYSIQGLSIPLAFTTLTISVAFGLCIVAMAYSIGNVSGCHINPAVSIGCFVAGRMTIKELIGYVIAQFAGGLAGAFILSQIIGSKVSLGQNGYGDSSVLGINAPKAVLIEIILTFVFVMVILCVTSKPEFGSVAGLVIGLTLTLIHIFGIPFTGTSVNPARSFGPAVLAGGDALKQLPVFIIAPVIGAVLAALFFTYVLDTGAAEADETEETDENGESAEETDEAEAEADGVEAEAAETGAAADGEDEAEADAEEEAPAGEADEAAESEEPAEADDAEADGADDSEEEPAVDEDEEDKAEESKDSEAEDNSEGKKKKTGGYDAASEMMIDDEPESVAEAEAEVIEEADAEAMI